MTTSINRSCISPGVATVGGGMTCIEPRILLRRFLGVDARLDDPGEPNKSGVDKYWALLKESV